MRGACTYVASRLTSFCENLVIRSLRSTGKVDVTQEHHSSEAS